MNLVTLKNPVQKQLRNRGGLGIVTFTLGYVPGKVNIIKVPVCTDGCLSSVVEKELLKLHSRTDMQNRVVVEWSLTISKLLVTVKKSVI